MRFPEFHAAKRYDVPDYLTANIYAQNQKNLNYRNELANSREDQKDLMSLPGKGYTMYTDMTGHEPLKDLVNKLRANKELPPPGSTNDMMPKTNVVTPGNPNLPEPLPTGPVDQMKPGGTPSFNPAGTALGAGLGGVAAAYQANQKGMHRDRVIGKGIGGAALGSLPMTAGPLAALGPPGWAALAGQSALALYGLLG